MSKAVWLGSRLRYPITISKITKSPGTSLKKGEAALQYSFEWTREVGDRVRGETWQEKQVTLVDWDSPIDGTISRCMLREGQEVRVDTICFYVDEGCSHEIQYQGLCGLCGKDMTEVTWASEKADTTRATINMAHDQTGLMISKSVAVRTEHDTQRRLLRQEKLSLVVDLDQTIIHACIEPTIGEWQADPTNPNHEAVKDVRAFQLNDDGVVSLRGGDGGLLTSRCWYYIKMRPGLAKFLADIAELYELHVYTMGTRAYALNIAKIVDPDQKLFGNRVISRDENGSMLSKSLQRLFPVSTNLVVIIDDRADVWPRNRLNLVKVAPYDFFKGIGDINSSFLPKRADILPDSGASSTKEGSAATTTTTTTTTTTSTTAPNATQASTSSATSPSSSSASNPTQKLSTATSEDLLSADEKLIQEIQAQEQAKSLEKQIIERPLLHMQEELDKEDEEKESQNSNDGNEASQDEPHSQNNHHNHHHHHRHNLLRDDDQELFHLQKHLTSLHSAFYDLYRQRCDKAGVTVPSAVAGPEDKTSIDLSLVPDVGLVLTRLKTRVLQGTVVVLSGLVPLGIDVLQSEIGLQTISFGARLQSKVTKHITHLVVSSARPRTQKAQQAARIPGVKIVDQAWLTDSLSQWEKLNETPYLVDLQPWFKETGKKSSNHKKDSVSATETDEDDDDEDQDMSSDIDTESDAVFIDSNGLRQVVAAGTEVTDHGDNDDDGDDEEEEIDPGATSPLEDLKGFDWGGADDELKEFLGSDDDDDFDDEDDNQSVASDSFVGNNESDNESTTSTSSRRRRRKQNNSVNSKTPSSGSSGLKLVVGTNNNLKRKAADETDDSDSDNDKSGGMSSDDGGSPSGRSGGGGGSSSALAKKKRIALSRGGSGLRSVVMSGYDEDSSTGDGKQTASSTTQTNSANNNSNSNAVDDDEDLNDEDLEADLIAELEAAGDMG